VDQRARASIIKKEQCRVDQWREVGEEQCKVVSWEEECRLETKILQKFTSQHI